MEIVDIYDRDRNKTGVTKPKGEPLEPDEYICIAHVVVFNQRGEMLIQKRANDKLDWPGRWDITAGGGAMAGECSAETAQRELMEELGLRAELVGERPVFTICYDLGFDDYYVLTVEDIPLSAVKCQLEEVKGVQWASQEQILNMMRQGSFVAYKEGFIEFLFAARNGRGSYDRAETR